MAVEKEIIIKVDDTKATKSIEDLNDSIKELNKTIVQGNKKTEKAFEDVDKQAKATGKTADKTSSKLKKGFEGGAKGVGKFSLAVKGVGLALKAAGIGLIIGALVQFQNLFTGDLVSDSLTIAAETINNIFRGQGFKEATENAKETLRLRKEIEISEIKFQITQLKNQELAEKQRQTRDDVSKSINDRITANKTLGVILEDQLESELARAEINKNFLKQRSEITGTQEDLLAYLNAEVKISEINERITSQRSEQKVNEIGLQQELNLLKETEAQLVNEVFRLDESEGLERILRDEIRLENAFILEDAILAKRLENSEIGTQAFADATLERQELEKDFIINSLKLDRDYRKAKEADERALATARINIAVQTFSVLASLFDENTKAGKAAAAALIVAEQIQAINGIIQNTALANAKAVAASPLTFGQPWVTINNITAGLGIAGSVVAGAKALGQLGQSGKSTSGGGGSVGGGGVASASQQAPDFNIVGTSGINQIADAVNSQVPLRAYVTSGDISSQQALDRDIQNTAVVG